MPEGFVFLFLSSARIGNQSVIQENIGVNPPGASLTFGRNVTVTPQHTAAGDTVRIGASSSVYRVLTGAPARLFKGPGVATVIEGTTTFPLCPDGLPCPVGPFDCSGGQRLEVARNGTATEGPLQFGNATFGDLVLHNAANLILRPGNYTFCSIFMARNSSLTILGPQQSTINVVGNVRIANGAFFGPVSGVLSPNLNIQGLGLRIGANALVQAFIKAPNAQLSAGRSAVIKGSLCLNSARSDKNITLLCPPLP